MLSFSHRRSPSPPGAHAMVSSVAACCARLIMHFQWDDSAVFRFFVPGDLDLWPITLTFELGRDFCTLYLTKLPTLIILRLVVRKLSCGQTNTLTNKQTPLKTSTALRYATHVGKYICADGNNNNTVIFNAYSAEEISNRRRGQLPGGERWIVLGLLID